MTGLQEKASTLDEDCLRRLIEAGRSLVAERELERVFDRLLEAARELTGAGYAAIGDHASPEGARPASPRRLVVPIEVRGATWGRLHLADKAGGDFDDSDREATAVLAGWAGIAVENARLYRETDERRIELERSVRALEATFEIARAVGGETRLDRVLELIAKRSRALVEASSVVIFLSDGDEFVVAATAGDVPSELTGERVPVSQSAAGAVLAAGRPERVADLLSAPRFSLSRFGVRPASALFVPLMFHGAHVGVIEAFDRVDGPEFRIEDERMLLAAAASAATAVATAQSVERDRLRRSLKAAEEERRRWARELHDETLQSLGALRMMLCSARRRDDAASLRAALDGAVEHLGSEIANLRSLITELRPATLDELGLRPALEALFERVRAAHGLEIAARVELERTDKGPGRLDPEIETAVYRVVQESLTNAARHARAERVVVEVLDRGDTIRIAIRDDGRGFDVDAPSTGFGLTGMRERVSLAGGRLLITSSPSGTAIAAGLPVPRRAGDRAHSLRTAR